MAVYGEFWRSEAPGSVIRITESGFGCRNSQVSCLRAWSDRVRLGQDRQFRAVEDLDAAAADADQTVALPGC